MINKQLFVKIALITLILSTVITYALIKLKKTCHNIAVYVFMNAKFI